MSMIITSSMCSHFFTAEFRYEANVYIHAVQHKVDNIQIGVSMIGTKVSGTIIGEKMNVYQ